MQCDLDFWPSSSRLHWFPMTAYVGVHIGGEHQLSTINSSLDRCLTAFVI